MKYLLITLILPDMDTEDAGEVNGHGEWRLTVDNTSHPRLRKTAKTNNASMEIEEAPEIISCELKLESGPTTPSTPQEVEHETFRSILYQIFLPLTISGLVMVGTGMYFDVVQNWPAFVNSHEVMTLVPALLGLKGNLEMTLASRLSTEANLGRMTGLKEVWLMITGNLCLIQCQAVVVGLLSSIFAVCSTWLFYDTVTWKSTVMACACSVTTASIATFLLGLFTIAVIIISIYFNLNPDNVTTPIAASIGDVTSLVIFSYIASFMYSVREQHLWICYLCIAISLLLMPIWIFMCRNNDYTKKHFRSGWLPICSAMCISSFGGIALNGFVSKFKKLSAYQPVMNGVGGNLVTIQASRLATALHKSNIPLEQLPDETPACVNPYKVFFAKAVHGLTSRVLFFLAVPTHLTFLLIIFLLKAGHLYISPLFCLLYMILSTFQVFILLYLAYFLTHYFWKRGINPDSTTIPYLTAIGDLLGILFLGFIFTVAPLSYNDGDD